MKTTITALAFGLMLSGAAFAETVKPIKPVTVQTKLDQMTTQSIDQMANCIDGKMANGAKCGPTISYPDNILSGMNLGF